MAHPVIWPKRICFYPIGNTPPTCFTAGLAPEEKAQILLLACGDPRSILFTVYSDYSDTRLLDITCCDWEPAVLARNILLFTMVADGIRYIDIWSIFYDFFLAQDVQDILLSQCRLLVNASSDIASWKKTKYANYLRFCTENTLLEIRRFWMLYIENITLEDEEKDSLKRAFVSGMKAVQEKYTKAVPAGTMRSAAPLAHTLPKSFNSHQYFWSTGITTPDTTLGISPPHLNPTFAHCQAGRKFHVHYATDPLQCFHLAPALTVVKGGKSSSPSTINPKSLYASAIDQFSSWCSSFKKKITTPNVIIRFFVGEALSFGRALLICQESKITHTGVYAQPWGGSQINFDVEDYTTTLPSARTAPLTFNVINTSNVADHTGLLNLLVVTRPLLQRKPSSAIHTDTLLRPGDYQNPGSILASYALVDIPTLSILLDIAPSQCLSHFTSCSNAHEILAALFTTRQCMQPTAWKICSIFGPQAAIQPEAMAPTARLVCDPSKFARFILSVYMQMFAEDKMPSTESLLNHMDLSSGTIIVSPLHYLRSSLALFLRWLKRRVDVNWAKTMEIFFELLLSDYTLMAGFNHCQDLLCHLHLYDVGYLPDIFRPQFLLELGGSRVRFQGWRDIPVIVCVVLKIPRSHLKSLENIDENDIGTPTLQCESVALGTQGQNFHSSIQPIFGDIEVSCVDNEHQISVKEDRAAFGSSSPLIVSFYMPTWIILKNKPNQLQIGLHIRNHASNSDTLAATLGPTLCIYRTDLTNHTNVHIVRYRPDNVNELRYTKQVSILDKNPTPRRISLAFDSSGTKVNTLTIRDDITETTAAKSLSEGAVVGIKAVSDRKLLVTFGNHIRHFEYPFPIQGDRVMTRIARKSRYVEIEAPIRPDFKDISKLSLNPFASAYFEGSTSLQNMHYLNLDILPAVLFNPATNFDWISTNVGMSLSPAERELETSSSQKDEPSLVELKKSIVTLFMEHCGLINPRLRPTVFGLSHPVRGTYALIFVNDIKLDVAAYTVVADACVVFCSGEELNQSLVSSQYKNADFDVCLLKTLEGETRLWMKLFPILAERCRTWKHTLSCEYLTEGIPIASNGLNSSPLCKCGRGKHLGAFSTTKDWEQFAPRATRIALGPLFTFSSMEEHMKIVKGEIVDALSKCSKCKGPGKPKLLVCSRCKVGRYCSTTCQKSDWKEHKSYCSSKAFIDNFAREIHGDYMASTQGLAKTD